MGNKIKPIHLKDLDNAMKLYASCYENDTYFQKLFGTDDAYSDILTTFRQDVQNASLFGYAAGYYVDKTLVGMLLAINVNDWRNNHAEAYTRLFQSDKDVATKWYLDVKKVFRKEDTNLIYIFQIAVDERWRMRGIATQLLKRLISDYGKKFTIFSDLTNAKANKLWTNNGFKLINTEGGNVFVVRR